MQAGAGSSSPRSRQQARDAILAAGSGDSLSRPQRVIQKTSAKELCERMRGMSIWDSLGRPSPALQQRVWTLGNSVHANVGLKPPSPNAAQHGVTSRPGSSLKPPGCADQGPAAAGWGGVARGGATGAASGASPLAPHSAVAAQGWSLPEKYTSSEPLSVKDGVEFTSVAAGGLSSRLWQAHICGCWSIKGAQPDCVKEYVGRIIRYWSILHARGRDLGEVFIDGWLRSGFRQPLLKRNITSGTALIAPVIRIWVAVQAKMFAL
eukprot:1151778-Pelagomonas_calceolata.AAC.2